MSSFILSELWKDCQCLCGRHNCYLVSKSFYGNFFISRY